MDKKIDYNENKDSITQKKLKTLHKIKRRAHTFDIWKIRSLQIFFV